MQPAPVRWLRSTSVRFAALLFLMQIAISGSVLLFVLRAGDAQLERFRREWVTEIQFSLVDVQRRNGHDALVSEIADRLVDPGVAIILLADRRGQPIIGNLDAWPATLPQRSDWRVIDLYRSGSQTPKTVLLVTTLLPDGNWLLTGRVKGTGARVSAIYRQAIIIGALISVLVALASAWFLGRALSRQLDSVIETTEAVGDGSISPRVRLTGAGDAFDRLRASFNAMLDRIDQLVGELRLTSDGLAHDLKSPLTRLRATIDNARRATHDPVALAAFERIDGECDQLAGMLSTALLISRTIGGIGREQMEPTDVGVILAGIAELYGPLGEEALVDISWEAPAGLEARLNRPLIEQAIGNLVDNALRYATGATRIRLSARLEADRVLIAVADDGPGIPPERHADALRRFGRLDPARGGGGSGLGLPLVAAVARLHDGNLALEDNRPGLRALLSLPR